MMELRAKSNGQTLQVHTNLVVEREVALRYALPIAPNVSRGARYHDIGKSADFFQKLMYGSSPSSWHRHELLSLLLLISNRTNFRLTDMELAAVATHHRNLDHDDLTQWMEHSARDDIKQIVIQELSVHWSEMSNLFGKFSTNFEITKTIKFLRDLRHEAQQNTIWSDIGRELWTHRAILVAADHMASAGVDNSLLGKNITRRALRRYMRKQENMEWRRWRPIQRQSGRLVGSAILTAPTGSGKTEAALLWMLRNRKRYERIFFVLPYQVSINAMAERLSAVFPDEQQNTNLYKNDTVSALHSNTALAYLRSAMKDGSSVATEGVSQEKALQIAQKASDAARKIYSPLKVTTVYQLLDIFFGRKFFEVGLLELTDSLVIFDEIHAYDGHTLGLTLVLLDCLRRLGARVFIMTATLPSNMNETLRLAAGIDINNRLHLEDVSILTEVRRTVHLDRNLHIEEMMGQIRNAVQSGKRVAVVCNTVDKAIRLAEQLQDLSPMLIHSRFTIGQRAERETQENLRDVPFVISTQVIEVSIDVSFDVMFTELAPIDDLLQRFGRVNRHELHDPTTHGVCYIALAEDRGSEKIYGKELLNRTRTTLLSDAQDESDCPQTQPLDYERACKWVESVYPNGLPTEENEAMCNSRRQFQDVVDNLRPMLDATQVDLEKNLFRSVQVVPAQYALEWQELKKQKRHLEAKKLIVNVDERVWNSCCEKNRDVAKDTITYGSNRYKRKQIIALFPYDSDCNGKFNGTGLRLDQDPVPTPLTKLCFFSDDED